MTSVRTLAGVGSGGVRSICVGAAALVLAAASSACGSGEGEEAAPPPPVVTTTTPDPVATAVATTPSMPPATVARPGPPAVTQCAVVVDDPAPPGGGTVALTVLSSVPGATFLARVVLGATSTTADGTVDGSGSGTARLSVPAAQGGQSAQVEVSVAGGAETCSATITPR